MVYKKHEPHYLNCIRIKYIEDSYKQIGIKRATVLGNCYVNKLWIGCVYSENLEYEIIKYKSKCFDNGNDNGNDKLSNFYMNTIKQLIK